jgi:hypothetical protein
MTSTPSRLYFGIWEGQRQVGKGRRRLGSTGAPNQDKNNQKRRERSSPPDAGLGIPPLCNLLPPLRLAPPFSIPHHRAVMAKVEEDDSVLLLRDSPAAEVKL